MPADVSAKATTSRRRILRACDRCRSRKVKCDGEAFPGSQCSNCQLLPDSACTYVETQKRRGPPKGYVESLESRLERVDKLLRQVCPGVDFTTEMNNIRVKFKAHRDKVPHVSSPESLGSGPPEDKSSLASPEPSTSTSRTVFVPAAYQVGTVSRNPVDVQDDRKGERGSGVNVIKTVDYLTSGKRGVMIDDESPRAENAGPLTSTKEMDNLVANFENINLHPASNRFFGKSSTLVLFQSTLLEVRTQFEKDGGRNNSAMASTRNEFWLPQPWEQTIPNPSPPPVFPPPELMSSLINLYFRHNNDFVPLLHRPTFEHWIAQNYHLRGDSQFGATVLLVLALGAKHSNDPRVYMENSSTTRSAGFKYFRQVHDRPKAIPSPANLYDIQVYVLSILYLETSSSPQTAWAMIGQAIRVAQDVGGHRRKAHSPQFSVEDELWKRAFWVLVYLDRVSSYVFGRPVSILDEDMDLELPIEVDDEYWYHENPAQAYQQPRGKPAKVAFFNSLLRLSQVLVFATRTLYSLNSSKPVMGFVGADFDRHIISELDGALNAWLDTVPSHLRSNTKHQHALFAEQSASLYGWYYDIQIVVHRPFMQPSDGQLSPLSKTSRIICFNAARLCAATFDSMHPRTHANTIAPGHMHLRTDDITHVFNAGLILMMSIFGTNRIPHCNPVKGLIEVRRCMDILHRNEARCHCSGRLWDGLNELTRPFNKAAPAQHNLFALSGNANVHQYGDPPHDELDDWSHPASDGVPMPEFDMLFGGDIVDVGRVFSEQMLGRTNPPSQESYEALGNAPGRYPPRFPYQYQYVEAAAMQQDIPFVWPFDPNVVYNG